MMIKTNDQCKSLKRSHKSFHSGWALLIVIAVALFAGSLELAAAEGVTVQKPWLRFIIKASPAAGYFTLKNETGTPLKLIGASSPACGKMMLHQSKEVNGVEHMMPVKSVTVPAHGMLSFHPGSYHIMCMKPQSIMVVGHKVPVTLKFADGKTVSTQFSVTGPGDK
jgi:copper(I)-binding protein